MRKLLPTNLREDLALGSMASGLCACFLAPISMDAALHVADFGLGLWMAALYSHFANEVRVA
jgi:hypothetical protein